MPLFDVCSPPRRHQLVHRAAAAAQRRQHVVFLVTFYTMCIGSSRQARFPKNTHWLGVEFR